MFVIIQGIESTSAEELIFESISDQLVKNMNAENTEKEITFENEAIFVILVFVTLLFVTLGITGSILIAKSFSMALGFRQEN